MYSFHVCSQHCHHVIRNPQQDSFVLQEVRKRLREQSFEKYSSKVNFQEMKQLTQAGVEMHTQLLDYRYKMRHHLQKTTEQDVNILHGKHSIYSSRSKPDSPSELQITRAISMLESTQEPSRIRHMGHWKDIWVSISARTGITDPDIFFQRYNNW